MAYAIKKGSDYFNTVLYTGNGSTQSITGVGFSPDLVWVKNRNSTQDHSVYDTVRGISRRIYTNGTFAEDYNVGNGITSFDSDGWTTGSLAGVNTNSNTYVAWNWKAGESTVENTDGSITSQVSANPTSGFSVVTYTGNATTGATVGHGLGTAPNMYIIKDRDGVSNWVVFNDNLAANNNLYLNTTDVTFSSAGFAGMGATSSVLQLPTGGINSTNQSGNKYVAYCFAEVEGFSKFGSYLNNASTDGPFVYLGFRPAFVMIKYIASGASDWMIFDSARDPYNVIPDYLRSNLTNAETTKAGGWIDFISNGFKVRNTDATTASINFTGGTAKFIYMAFAETPFKFANAR